MFPKRQSSFSMTQQRGFLLPLAMFIVLGLGVLAITLSRISGQNSIAVVQEGVSSQAFYAAESGAQFGMNQLFYVASGGAVLSRALVDGNCTAVNGNSLNFTRAGLNNCAVQLTCSITNDPGNTTSFYSLSSAAACGTGTVTAQRTIQVSSVMR